MAPVAEMPPKNGQMICDHCGEKGFDGPQHGNGERGPHELLDALEGDVGKLKLRQPFHCLGTEFGADGGDDLRVRVPEVDDHRRDQNGDDGRRNGPPAFGPADNDAEREQAQGETLPLGS